jgi:hypothetical protein
VTARWRATHAGAVGAVVNLDQFFRSWLIGVLFVLSLALGSLALLMLQHLSGGQWGLVGRRVFEAATRTLPVVALLFVPLFFGLPRVFLWAQPEAVAADHILQMKQPYLNAWFFIVRAVLYFAYWLACVWVLNKWSEAQDRGEGVTKLDSVRFRRVSAPGLLFLVITVSFASVDWVMSLEPEWFSTIFGLLTIAGYGLTALAFTVVVLSLVHRGDGATVLNPRHFHDLGKLLLAFTMLWAYLSFSQFLIIWSGNLPEEIPWYIARISGSWGAVAIALVVGHFAIPFAMLLSASVKKRSASLARIAAFILVMRLVDMIWYVAPSFRHDVGDAAAAAHVALVPIHWMDLAIPIGLAGLWVFLFARQFRARALFPVNDPYFKEAFAHDPH